MVCCVGENEHRERKQYQIYYTPKAFYFPMSLCFSNSCKTLPSLFGLFFVVCFFFPLVYKLTFLIVVFSTADNNPHL